MESPGRSILDNLVILSKIDSHLAGIFLERKKWEKQIADHNQRLKKLSADLELREKTIQERRRRYDKEDKHIRDERQKLTDRRKSLATLGNYKLQQAAEREIEHTSKQLTLQEDTLLKMLEEIDSTDKEYQTLLGSLNDAKASLVKLETEMKETFATLEERQKQYEVERLEALKVINAPMLTAYERVRERYPTDAVVPVRNGNCSSCFMHTMPQMVVHILKGDSLVRCRGCARILYLEETK